MHYRRNADQDLRMLERRLAITNLREDALALYYARKRNSDPRAGYEWYSWLLEQEYEKEDSYVSDPYGTVWLVGDNIYCDECGENIGFDAANTAGEIPHSFFPSFMDHPDYGEYNLDAAREHVRDLYAHKNLFELLKEIPSTDSMLRNIDRNLSIVCGSCDSILKLRNYPARWDEALGDPPN